MKKFDREPIAWITRGGKHIPIFEKQFSVDGKYLNLSADKKSVTSIPEQDEGQSIVFSNDVEETLNLTKHRDGGFYVWTNKWDRKFKTLQDVADFLNENNYKYYGVDDYD